MRLLLSLLTGHHRNEQSGSLTSSHLNLSQRAPPLEAHSQPGVTFASPSSPSERALALEQSPLSKVSAPPLPVLLLACNRPEAVRTSLELVLRFATTFALHLTLIA